MIDVSGGKEHIVHIAFKYQVHVNLLISLGLVYLIGGLKCTCCVFVCFLFCGKAPDRLTADEVAEMLLSQNVAAFCLLG